MLGTQTLTCVLERTWTRVAFHLKGMAGLYEASTKTRSPTLGTIPFTQLKIQTQHNFNRARMHKHMYTCKEYWTNTECIFFKPWNKLTQLVSSMMCKTHFWRQLTWSERRHLHQWNQSSHAALWQCQWRHAVSDWQLPQQGRQPD